MARISIGNGILQVALGSLERVGGLHGDIKVPLSAVRGAHVAERPFAEIRGIRFPGTGLPWVIALGTWRYGGGKDFVAVYKGQRAIVLDLDEIEFNRLIIGTPDPDAVLARLRGLSLA